MTRYVLTMSVAMFFAVLGAISCAPAVAGEIAIYESLSDVTIGRVFLTPTQRAYLDTRPVASPKPVQEAPLTEPVKKRKNPAGYIINGSGESRVWSQQGFVNREDASGISFPGDVRILRKETTEVPDSSSTEKSKSLPNSKSDTADNGA